MPSPCAEWTSQREVSMGRAWRSACLGRSSSCSSRSAHCCWLYSQHCSKPSTARLAAVLHAPHGHGVQATVQGTTASKAGGVLRGCGLVNQHTPGDLQTCSGATLNLPLPACGSDTVHTHQSWPCRLPTYLGVPSPLRLLHRRWVLAWGGGPGTLLCRTAREPPQVSLSP